MKEAALDPLVQGPTKTIRIEDPDGKSDEGVSDCEYKFTAISQPSADDKLDYQTGQSMLSSNQTQVSPEKAKEESQSNKSPEKSSYQSSISSQSPEGSETSDRELKIVSEEENSVISAMESSARGKLL